MTVTDKNGNVLMPLQPLALGPDAFFPWTANSTIAATAAHYATAALLLRDGRTTRRPHYATAARRPH